MSHKGKQGKAGEPGQVPDDELDGCSVKIRPEDRVPDEELWAVVLAGGLEGDEAKKRIDEYGELFGTDDA